MIQDATHIPVSVWGVFPFQLGPQASAWLKFSKEGGVY